MGEPVVLKRSPFLLVRNLIIVQVIAALAYFIMAVVGNYQEIYTNLNLPQVTSYEIARFLFILAGEAALVVFVFLRWFFATDTVHETMLVRERGILMKRRYIADLAPPLSASYHANAFSKALGYGTLLIRDRAMRKPLMVAYVVDPESAADFIAQSFGDREGTASKLPADIGELLGSPERENLEFKASFRWDVREGKINRALEKSVMKTIAAFLNSSGGGLVIGADDGGAPVGLESDYATLRRQDADGFENHFTHVFNSTIGPEFRRFVKLSFEQAGDKEVCVVRVSPAVQPAYARFEGDEQFFVRTGNSTTALQLSEAAKYIQSRWRKRYD